MPYVNRTLHFMRLEYVSVSITRRCLTQSCRKLTSAADAQTEILAATETVEFESLNNMSLRLITPQCSYYKATYSDLPVQWNGLPWWGFLWPGGYGVARYIMEHGELIKGRNVFDFAAGGGVGAIVSAVQGAHSVVVNDICQYAIEASKLNVQLNKHLFLKSKKEPRKIISYKLENVVGNTNLFDDTDIILAGDILYDDELAYSLFPWFQELVADRGIDIYVGDPGRWILSEMDVTTKNRIFEKVACYDLPEFLQKEHHGLTISKVYRVKALD